MVLRKLCLFRARLLYAVPLFYAFLIFLHLWVMDVNETPLRENGKSVQRLEKGGRFKKILSAFGAACSELDTVETRVIEPRCFYVHDALVEASSNAVFFYLPYNPHLQSYVGAFTRRPFPLTGTNAFNARTVWLHPVASRSEWEKMLTLRGKRKVALSRVLGNESMLSHRDTERGNVHQSIAVVETLFLHTLFPSSWSNMWHGFADYFVSVFFTLSSFLAFYNEDPSGEKLASGRSHLRPFDAFDGEMDVPFFPSINYLTYTLDWKSNRCLSAWSCSHRPMFDPFRRLFRGGVFFSEAVCRSRGCRTRLRGLWKFQRRVVRLPHLQFSGSGDRKHRPKTSFDWLYARTLLLGVNIKCSVTRKGINTDTCKRNLWNVRNTVLGMFNIDPNTTVWDLAKGHSSRNKSCLRNHSQSATTLTIQKNAGVPVALETSDRQNFCPSVYMIQRRSKKRFMWGFDESVKAVQQAFKEYPICCSSGCMSTYSADVSYSTPFKKQLEIMNSHTILFAGRGAGASLYMFLPLGATLVAVTGNDRWQAYSDLEPPWITVKLLIVHILDAHRLKLLPYTADSNLAAYLLDPPTVAHVLREVASNTLLNNTYINLFHGKQNMG